MLTATDTANSAVTGAQANIQVNAAAATRLVLVAPVSLNVNAPFSVTVTALDASGNVATGYRGKVAFRSSDASAVLPKSYTFTAADQGVHTFTGLRLKKKGIRTLTVTDAANNFTSIVSIDVR